MTLYIGTRQSINDFYLLIAHLPDGV